MEGYFPINEYCRLANISTDTAYHRTNRKKVPFFIDNNNRMFIYFSDEGPVVPEDFISVVEFAIKNNTSDVRIRNLINRGVISSEDYIRIPKSKFFSNRRGGVYVRESIKLTNTKMDNIRKICPEGYITLNDWCKKVDMPIGSAVQFISRGKLKIYKFGGHRYVKEETQDPRKRKVKGYDHSRVSG